MPANAKNDERRLDLDRLRIAAFGLLILYHVGMFYVTWDWHVKSSRASEAIEPLMLLVNPWRLTLLFIISGAATRFMADKQTTGRLLGSRMWRLWPPLILAVLVIVPPQSYYEIVDAMRLGQLSESPVWLDNFYLKYITASGNWCDAEGCLITPTYNHMWFVAYLIVYTLILIALLPLIRRWPQSWRVPAPILLIAPWLFLWATRVTLSPLFGETHAIWADWYLHTIYLAAFLFGFGVAKYAAFFEACARWRFLALAGALVCWATVMAFYITYRDTDPTPLVRNLARGARELQAWSAIVAAFGFGWRRLRGADGPVRRYMTQAIFPFYIVHQTIIVVAAFHLNQLGWPLWAEGATLIALTALGCIATFEIVRRVPWLRPWFGLRSPVQPASDKTIEFATGGTKVESQTER